MSTATAAYRVRQFFRTLAAPALPVNEARARARLTPAQLEAWSKLSRADRAHALRVLAKLEAGGPVPPPLAQAALLHDVGKAVAPISLPQRVFRVLARRLTPSLWRRLSSGSLEAAPAWRRGLIALAQHPRRGARLALEAGSDPLVARLIERHEEFPRPEPPRTPEDELLIRLQRADSNN